MKKPTRHIGSAVYINVKSFWGYDTAPYLLGEYQSHDAMVNIAEYQRKWRFYGDEVLGKYDLQGEE